ncbi:MAG: glycosyltransferase [Streptosporangiales bacterium]|nr:glycosyltransferase [Streptosporangiales bacterium]
MRIAIVTETWRPYTDGVVTRLVATVRELRRRQHEVLVIAPRGGEADFDGATVRGVPTFSVPFVYGGRPWGIPLPRVRRYLRDFRPDVVHVVNPIMLGIAGVTAAVSQGVPLVTSYHTNVGKYASYYHLGWLRPVIRFAEWLLHRRAAVSLATSAAACAELREREFLRVRLWRRGVDLKLFNPARRARREGPINGYPVPGTPVTVLYVGRLAEEKDLHRLESLALSDEGMHLKLVGDGPAGRQLRQRFAGGPVTFTGELFGDDLADAYADADVFVFPSTTETLGLVLLEALASGLPVVAPDTPVSREILGDCPACQFFPVDDPGSIPTLIKELLDRAPSSELGRAARREVESWSWEEATAQLVEYYEEARASHRPSRGG